MPITRTRARSASVTSVGPVSAPNTPSYESVANKSIRQPTSAIALNDSFRSSRLNTSATRTSSRRESLSAQQPTPIIDAKPKFYVSARIKTATFDALAQPPPLPTTTVRTRSRAKENSVPPPQPPSSAFITPAPSTLSKSMRVRRSMAPSSSKKVQTPVQVISVPREPASGDNLRRSVRLSAVKGKPPPSQSFISDPIIMKPLSQLSREQQIQLVNSLKTTMNETIYDMSSIGYPSKQSVVQQQQQQQPLQVAALTSIGYDQVISQTAAEENDMRRFKHQRSLSSINISNSLYSTSASMNAQPSPPPPAPLPVSTEKRRSISEKSKKRRSMFVDDDITFHGVTPPRDVNISTSSSTASENSNSSNGSLLSSISIISQDTPIHGNDSSINSSGKRKSSLKKKAPNASIAELEARIAIDRSEFMSNLSKIKQCGVALPAEISLLIPTSASPAQAPSTTSTSSSSSVDPLSSRLALSSAMPTFSQSPSASIAPTPQNTPESGLTAVNRYVERTIQAYMTPMAQRHSNVSGVDGTVLSRAFTQSLTSVALPSPMPTMRAQNTTNNVTLVAHTNDTAANTIVPSSRTSSTSSTLLYITIIIIFIAIILRFTDLI